MNRFEIAFCFLQFLILAVLAAFIFTPTPSPMGSFFAWSYIVVVTWLSLIYSDFAKYQRKLEGRE